MNDKVQIWFGYPGMRLVAMLSFAPLSALSQGTATPPAVSQPPAPVLRAYIDFAMQNQGNAAKGRELFASEQKALCAMCHSLDGTNRKAGPDLSFVGEKFPRRELIRSILEPSAGIAVGYGTTVVETKAGETFLGVIKQSTDAWLELMGMDGKPVRIEKSGIKEERTSGISLMPEGLVTAMTHQELADVVAYLETLRQPETAIASTRGMPAQIPIAARAVELQPFFSDKVRLNRPVWFGGVPGFTNRFIVLEHGGKSWIIERKESGDAQETFVDWSGQVRVGGATGLLSLAFHPQFGGNRKYYLKYQIAEDGRISTLLVERQFAPDFKSDSGQPARLLLKIPSTTEAHNGGALAFGPDGLLYLGMGDTGPQEDPQGHGQNMNLWLGKILRIDVDRSGNDLPYAIPTENPFRNIPNTRPEIWAYGFREPWRISFDRATGDLWVGDVGQNKIEEVSIVRAGENHGWNVFEGFTPFSNRYRREEAKYIPPVFAYPRREGISVTAGYVYRGTRAPAMAGRHICGDFESRRIWALAQTNRILTNVVEIGRAPTRIVSFSEDSDGELYLVGYDAGVIYRMNLASVDPTPLEMRVLANTSEHEPMRWRYSVQRPPDDWWHADFDDSTWTSAPGGFGTSGTPGATVRTEWRTPDIWLRREFNLPADAGRPDAPTVALRLHHDEDAEIYVNGVEAAQLPRWTSGYVDVPIHADAARTLRAGRNVMAIHCRQVSGGQYIDAGLVEFIRPGQSTPKGPP